MLTPYPAKKFYFFEFEGRLVFNENSQNLIGVDEDPRFRIEPNKLKHILNYSFDPISLNFGYTRDEVLGLFLKNCDLTKAEAETEFFIMMNRPPYSYFNGHSYAEYASQTFDASYQSELRQQWETMGVNAVDGEDFQGNPIVYKKKNFTFYYARVQPLLRNMAENLEMSEYVVIAP
jgi:hypothetical protein